MPLSPSRIDDIFREHMSVVAASQQMSPHIALAANVLIDAIRRGGKLLLCGNGGSAADAQHFAAELVGRFLLERPGIPAIALTTDSSAVTSIGNDYGFVQVFSRQVEALGRPGDALVAFSTSGTSPNVVAAAQRARQGGLKVVSLTGESGGELVALSDAIVRVPSSITARIQEVHGLIVHALCELIESELN